MDRISESDWKTLEQVREAALERLCKAVLKETQRLVGESSRTWHERFQRTSSAVDECNRQIGLLTGDFHRSNAHIRLAAMKASELVSSEEFSRFSEATRSEVESLVQILYADRPRPSLASARLEEPN